MKVSAPLARPRTFNLVSLRRAPQSRRNNLTTPRHCGGIDAMLGGKKVCTEDGRKAKNCARNECVPNREQCTVNSPDCHEARPNNFGVRSFTHTTHRWSSGNVEASVIVEASCSSMSLWIAQERDQRITSVLMETFYKAAPQRPGLVYLPAVFVAIVLSLN